MPKNKEDFMRKINGKELSSVIKELKSPFTSYAVDFNGKPYIPYEIIRYTADKILGMNWTDEVKLEYQEIEKEHVVTAKVTITIYDDDGNLVSKRTGVRSDKFNRHSTKHKTKAGQIEWSGDSYSSITSKAFRKAFTKFGLGAQFAESNASGDMLYKVQQSEQDKSEVDVPKREKLKGNVTLVSTEDNKLFVFQDSQGKAFELIVSDPRACKNYEKLKRTAPGSTVCITFNSLTNELLEVA
jgi:hypothetical protein